MISSYFKVKPNFLIYSIITPDKLLDFFFIIGLLESALKIYDSNVNGKTPTDFYHCCDNILHTLVLIQSENGKIAEGYSDIKWGCNEVWQTSEKAFLFSFDKKRKYGMLTKKGRHVFSDSSCLLWR